MQGHAWERVVAPLPRTAVRWHACEVDRRGARMRLVAHLAYRSVAERLDACVGPEGWSFDLQVASAAAGSVAATASLRLGESSRSCFVRLSDRAGAYRFTEDGEAQAVDDDPAEEPLRASALSSCWCGFGGALPLRLADDGWVAAAFEAAGEETGAGDVDASTGGAAAVPGRWRPLHPPRSEAGGSPATPAAEARNGASNDANDDTNDDASDEASDKARRVIDRLMERLRDEGLGAQAARVVATHGGYGRDQEERRALYGALRSLLLERSAG